MTSLKKYRTALVGCGRISVFHIAALHALPHVEIVALCDLDDQLAREQASQNGILNVFTDMETMMIEVRPDVVHILTPPRTHLTLAMTAAKYRAHMYIEKPLASHEADARVILDAAQKAESQLCPGHSLLLDPALPPVQAVLALLQQEPSSPLCGGIS
jgi:predicted dehydrogenase